MSDIVNGRREIDGKTYWDDGKGGFVPDSMVKPQDKLQDEMVRKIVGHAEELSAQIARFREHCFNDVDGFVALLDQEYGVKRGGKKGNMGFITVDGLLRVNVQVAENIEFGPELQTAKTLVDECLAEWTAGSRDELRAVINRAFQVDSQGRINRGNLFYLLRWEIADVRWQEAMRAIKDSIRIVGTKRYVRIHRREAIDRPWQAISIDMATA